MQISTYWYSFCHQLTAAMIISTLYGMVMIAVLVGIMMQISQDGWLAPSSLFFFVVSGQLILTGLLHPREVSCRSFKSRADK
jgi:chitin synthase